MVMSLTALQDCYCKLRDQVSSLAAQVAELANREDLDEQQLDLTDCTLSISNGNSVDLGEALPQRPIFRMSQPANGVNVRRWNAPPDSVAHDDVGNIWTGPIDPLTGFPTHPNTPTQDVVENDWNYAGPQDQMEGWGWIEVPAGGTYLRDNNGNTGERGEAWIGLCCGTPTRQPGYFEGTNTGADRNIMDVVFVPEGIHFVYVRQSDLSANQGFDLEQSADGVGGWSNFPAAQSFATKPEVECDLLDACDPVPSGWSLCPPTQCAPVITPGGGSGGIDEAAVQALIDASLPAPSDLAPIADNEVDTAIRTGQAGTSADYSRADHNHPIRRQGNPGAPIVTAGGSATLGQLISTYRFESDEETVIFGQRIQVTQPTGTNWGWIDVPNIAGFQRPIMDELHGYRYQTTTIQDDNGTLGAAPRGPVMNNEVSHWSFTQRLYLAYLRRPDDGVGMYVTARFKYIRS